MKKRIKQLWITAVFLLMLSGGVCTVFAKEPVAGTIEPDNQEMEDAVSQTPAEERLQVPESLGPLKIEASSATSISLSWQNAPGAAQYEIYKKTAAGEYTLEMTTKKTKCKVSIEKNQTYEFQVVPVAVSGTQSMKGKAASCSFTNKMTIKASLVSSKNHNVKLSWKKVSGAVSYQLYHKQNGSWIPLSKTKKLTKTVKLSGNNVNEYYRIKALDQSGNVTGILGSFKVRIPEAVKNLHMTVTSTTKVSLSWTAAAGANRYEIYKKTGSGKYQYQKTVKKTTASLKVKKNKKYTFKVKPVFSSTVVAISGKAATCSLNNGDIVSLNHQKYSYNEMVSDIKELAGKYSDYMTYGSIGKSEQGREIYDVILGNPDAKNTVLVVCSIHAREYATTAVCMKQLEYYLQNYNRTLDGRKVSKVFNNCNVHYVMMANPDGVVISQTKSSRWKGNANGVNLNRNFPYDFYVEGSRKDNSYSGAAPASEKETQAIVTLTKKLKKKANLSVVNYHAMGNIVFGGYSGENTTLKSKINKMYWTARNTTGYADAGGYSSSSHGNYREYLSYYSEIPSITIEIGSTPCPLPQSSYASIFNRNKLVLIREASLK